MTPSEWQGLLAGVAEFIRRLEASGEARFNLYGRNQFSDLLDHLTQNLNCPLTDELAVRASLAVVAQAGKDRSPPPADLVNALLARMRDPACQDPRGTDVHLRRAHEVTLAFLLGWRRCPGSPTCSCPGHASLFRIQAERQDWAGVHAGARLILWRVVHRQVSFCLDRLAQTNPEGGVPDFPTEDPRSWTDRVLNQFLAHVHRCDCWRKLAPTTDRGDLRGNARAKADCCLRSHNLDRWDPVERTRTGEVKSLWYFVERAVKGYAGRAFLHEGFPSGMLHAQLWEDGLRLVRVKLARRQCPDCPESARWSCVHGGYCPERDRLVLRDWLILQETDGRPRGGFVSVRVWRCPEDHVYPEELAGCPLLGCPAHGQARQKGSRRMTCYRMD
jgi:hypothetical protein